MTTTRPFGRIGPVTWLVLQGVATVVSILLAFGIDAWWRKLPRQVDSLKLDSPAGSSLDM